MPGKKQLREKRSKRGRRNTNGVFIYERLLLLNLHAKAIGGVLQDLAGARALRKNEAAYFGLMVEEARACISQSIVETMDAREVSLSAVASRRRIRMEKSLLESDD